MGIDWSRRWFLQTLAAVGLGGVGAGSAGARIADRDGSSRLGPWKARSGAGLGYDQVEEAVQLAMQNILREGTDHMFPEQFEVVRLRSETALQRELRDKTVETIFRPEAGHRGSLKFRSMLVPNQRCNGFRFAAHADLIDALLYLSYAVLIAMRVEPLRLPTSSLTIFSHRFAPQDGYLFDQGFTFVELEKTVLSRLRRDDSVRYLVLADVADFYGSIEIDRLSDVLRTNGVEECLVSGIADCLGGPGTKGLPVGSNASHVLAEATLLCVDRALTERGIEFTRFMDDFRIFAASEEAACQNLEELTNFLLKQGLRLNSAKTSIRSTSHEVYAAWMMRRRMVRAWGLTQSDPLFSLAADESADQQQKPPEDSATEEKKKEDGTLPPPLPEPNLPYGGQAPLKKSKLNESDKILLEAVDLEALSSELRQRAALNWHIPLGKLRLLVETNVYRDQWSFLRDVLRLAPHSPFSPAYIADVLIECRTQVPRAIKELATSWFAHRLTSNACASEFEILHVARLLGTEGYQAADSVAEYLQKVTRPLSPISIRMLASAFCCVCTESHKALLLELCGSTDAYARRRIVDLLWSQITESQKRQLHDQYPDEFRQDPFLVALSQSV